MRPAFDSTSNIPLNLDPEVKKREGTSKKVPRGPSQKASGPTLKKLAGSSSSGPKTPSGPQPRQLQLGDKQRTGPQPHQPPPADKQKAVVPEDNRDKKRKTLSGSEAVHQDPSTKKIPLRLKGPAQEISPRSRNIKDRTSALPIIEYLPEHVEELDEEFRKQLKAIIPDPEKGKGVVWRTGLPKDYPDSLGVYFPGYARMQTTLEPTDAERVDYSCEAFRITSTAEERKIVEDDPVAAMGRAAYHNHQAGFITGAIRDKLLFDNLKLHVPPPGVPPSTAAVIERDFFRDQMLSKHRVCNARLEEIKARRSEVVSYQKTMAQQQAALLEKEAGLHLASAKQAELEGEIAKRDRQLEEMKEKMKKQRDELPQEIIKKFLSSRAFAVASRVACDKMVKAVIYEELSKLSKLYPFDPEYCGYVEIPEDRRSVKALPGYTWDQEEDKLFNSKGKKVAFPKNFMSVEPREIPITWGHWLTWPIDVNNPDAGWVGEGEGQEDEVAKEGETLTPSGMETGEASLQAPQTNTATDIEVNVTDVEGDAEKGAPNSPEPPHSN